MFSQQTDGERFKTKQRRRNAKNSTPTPTRLSKINMEQMCLYLYLPVILVPSLVSGPVASTAEGETASKTTGVPRQAAFPLAHL